MSRRIFPGEKVKPLRERLGWTQQELADHLDLSQSLIACWENGTMIPKGPAAILLSQLQSREDLAEKSLVSA